MNRRLRERPIEEIKAKELRHYLRVCKKLEARAIKAVTDAKNENQSVG